MHGKIKEAVNGKKGQHMIKKRDSTVYFRQPLALKFQSDLYVGFFRYPFDFGCSVHNLNKNLKVIEFLRDPPACLNCHGSLEYISKR